MLCSLHKIFLPDNSLVLMTKNGDENLAWTTIHSFNELRTGMKIHYFIVPSNLMQLDCILRVFLIGLHTSANLKHDYLL